MAGIGPGQYCEAITGSSWILHFRPAASEMSAWGKNEKWKRLKHFPD